MAAPLAASSAPPLPRIRIRPFEPPDAPLLDVVLSGMSDTSRYQRYHGPKPRMSDSERRYLSATDGRDHVALVALDPAGEPVGIARFVRAREDPTAAEVAAEVVDAFQRRGIGTTLIGR